MDKIIEILMARDKMSYDDAKKLVDETYDEIQKLIDEECASLSEVEDVISCNLGLEPDYVDYFLM